MVIGPWLHGPHLIGKRHVGELDFGPEAELDRMRVQLRWYDQWLKARNTGVLDGPPVQVFLMGANRWVDLPDWPPPGVRYEPLFLGTGPSNSADSLNDGALSFTAPEQDTSSDSLTYDPAGPRRACSATPNWAHAIIARSKRAC
jgi:putative CocE/NonD family hydrolase